jgi:hypothetical protein
MKAIFLSLLLIISNSKAFSSTWVVCNIPAFPGHFTDLQAAINSPNTMPGDILLVQGSGVSYGDIEVTKKVIIMGPGYFLEENPETQTNFLSAKVNSVLFLSGGQFSVMQGMDVVGSKPRTENLGYGAPCWPYYQNDFGSFGVEINSGKISLISNRIASNLIIVKSDFNIVRQNIIYQIATTDTSIGNSFSNNIVTGIVQDHNSSYSNNYLNGNSTFHHFNNSSVTDNIVGASHWNLPCATWGVVITGGTWEHNICPWDVDPTSTNFGNVNFADIFLSTGSTDGKYRYKPNSLAAIHNIGPFAGSNPYKLSGISLHPNIFSVTMPNTVNSGTGLQVVVKVKAND